MPEEYTGLVEDLKALEQEGIGLPVAEDEWYTRPDTVSYGVISLEFESGNLNADNAKADRAYEGSVDLYSMARNGAGWVQLIEETLEEHCEACWYLNSRQYERDTGLFHWEWVFEV